MEKQNQSVCLPLIALTNSAGLRTRPTHGQHVKLRVEFDKQPRSPCTRGLFLNQDNNQKRIDRRSMWAHKRNSAPPGRWATALWITAVCKVKYLAVAESLCRWTFWDMPSEDIPFYKIQGHCAWFCWAAVWKHYLRSQTSHSAIRTPLGVTLQCQSASFVPPSAPALFITAGISFTV